MRRFIVPLSLAALVITACSTGQGFDRAGEMARLEQDCTAKGGTLAPTGRLTGEPALDNACRISPAEPRN